MTILPLLLCALAYPAPAALGGLYAHEAAALHVSELTYKEFDERNARVLARQISGAGTGRRTGKQMLEALLTERSILPRTMPDLTLERPATYGHVKAELHQLAAESRLPRFAEFLDQAFDHGLLYRFNDPYGTEYVGVTEAARQALGLDWPVPP
ncbi:MAG: hypothetical protein KGK30_00490, partial [Elusimicrobia bacterium]|nr:hypothetical protein [Elusimicrobiota bacterium]